MGKLLWSESAIFLAEEKILPAFSLFCGGIRKEKMTTLISKLAVFFTFVVGC